MYISIQQMLFYKAQNIVEIVGPRPNALIGFFHDKPS